MKKLINSLARALTLPMLLVIMITNGCTKSGTINPNPPGGGGVNPPSPPYLNAAFTAPRPWKGGSDTCNYTSNGNVKKDGSQEVTSPLYFTNISAPISFTLSATITVGNLTSSPTVRQMYANPYSQDTTDRCADLGLNGFGLWSNTSTVQSTNGGPWVPSVIDPVKWTYFPDGSRKNEFGGLSHWQISNAGGFTYINLGDIGNPPNIYKQESLSNNTTVLSKYSTDGTVLFMVTWTKVN